MIVPDMDGSGPHDHLGLGLFPVDLKEMQCAYRYSPNSFPVLLYSLDTRFWHNSRSPH